MIKCSICGDRLESRSDDLNNLLVSNCVMCKNVLIERIKIMLLQDFELSLKKE